MSYILDALKKIEHEKSRKSGPGGRLNISGDLFQERNRPKARAGIWKIVLLVVGVSLVTGAATWLLLPGYGRKSIAVIPPAALPAAPVPPGRDDSRAAAGSISASTVGCTACSTDCRRPCCSNRHGYGRGRGALSP